MTPFEHFKHDFKQKRVLVMGLGLLGRGVGDAKFLAEVGAEVTVTDLRTRTELSRSLKELAGLPIKFVLGEHRTEDFKKAEVIIRNAAVPQESPYLTMAQKNGAKILMDEALFAQYAPVNIIGVTGSRGKTTTTTLIYEILKAAGKPVFLAGNILGMATLPLLKEIKGGEWVVMELSSWQLQGFAVIKYSPQIAVITSLSPDHLNRYVSMSHYLSDKETIFKYQKKEDIIVINRDQKLTRDMAKTVKRSSLVWFSQKDFPQRWRLKVLGRHNRNNAAAALQVARAIKISDVVSRRVFAQFQGVPYRLQTVAEINGTKFINDTTSTTPTALMAAVKSFKQPLVLIAGGASKNLPLHHVAKTVARRVKKIVLLDGSGTAEFSELLEKFGGKSKIAGYFDNLELAVESAAALSVPGDIVLLSPGFASFGMFKNEFDRGQQFNRFVARLKNESQKKH